MRGFFSFPARFAFSPFDGGSEELPGVLGGTLRRLRLGNAGREGGVLLREKADLLHLRQDQRDEFFLAERINGLGSHPELESVRYRSVNMAAPLSRARDARQGVSSYL